jgi:hypothetical protein
MEGILSNRAQCERYPDLGACFEEYTRRRIAPLVPNLGTGMSLMRVMPVETAIKNNTRVGHLRRAVHPYREALQRHLRGSLLLQALPQADGRGLRPS